MLNLLKRGLVNIKLRLNMTNNSKFLLIIALVSSAIIVASSQDEGSIIKKSRIAKGNHLFVNIGTSFPLSKADYKPGLCIEMGHLFQMNRIVSIGPSVSFAKYQYNSAIPSNSPTPDTKKDNIYYEDGGYQINVVYFDGGDLSMLSLGLNVRANIVVPGKEYGLTIYGIAKPSVLYSTYSDVKAKVDIWYTNNIPPDPPADWQISESVSIDKYSTGYGYWSKESKVTAGMNLGFGCEYATQSGWGFNIQSTVGLIPTVRHINTSEFKNSIEAGYNSPSFPLVNKGFSTVNLTAGVSFRF